MNHLQVLDIHDKYKYVYYAQSTDHLVAQHDKMYGLIKAAGHALASDFWPVESGILLENDNEVIAGLFLNLTRSPEVILVHLVFVDSYFRQQGIYTKMHSLVDTIGRRLGRNNVYSYVHVDNELMQNVIMKKIGYEPVLHLVKRVI